VRKQTRDRLVLPILLPVGILVVILVALFGFSRILLSISHNAATVTALAVAMAIVVVSAVVAARRYVRPSSLAGLVGAVTGVAMIAGGLALATAGTEGEGGEAGVGTSVQIVAVNIAFQQTSITVPAGEPFQIVFDNQDAGVQHNVQIFDNPDFAGTPVFAGDIITGPAQITYDVPALEPGTYPFDCVVHPNMQGTIEAVEGGGEGGGEGGAAGAGGPTIAVAAQDIAFDTDTIELPADTPATIAFDNRDAGVQHNIAIYEDETLSTVLFQGELITGPATVEYQIPPLPEGEYYFHCDVHPNMKGTVIVSGGGGGSGGTPPDAGTTGPTGGGGGEATTQVTARGIAFDTAEIVLPAGQESTITFVNEDAGIQHNIAIATDSSLSDILFDGQVVTGPTTVTYTVPPLEPGTYYFYCVVHPNMNGVVTVR
jgi:plastocyanin